MSRRYVVVGVLESTAPIWAEPRWRDVFYVQAANGRHVAQCFSKRSADRICRLLNAEERASDEQAPLTERGET
jgi:carbamoylphosphate synthase large subunit